VASNNIARLGVILGLDSAEFIKGLDAANQKLYDFSVKAAGVAKDALLAAGVAFGAATYKAMEFADAIADVAKGNDVSIASILKLNDALANNGGEAENAGKLLAGFTKFMDNAATGSFEAQKSLRQAGISLKDLANLGTEDLFAKTVQGIASIQDPLTRNAKAMEVFGKAAKGVDFVGLAEDMRKTSATTDAQAVAVQAAADAYDLIKQRARDFSLTLTSEIGESLKLTIEYFIELSKEINGTGGLWSDVFNTVAYQTASLVHEIQDLIKVFGAWDDVLNAFFEARWSEIEGIISRRNAERASEEAKLEEFRLRLNKAVGGGMKESERGSWDSAPAKGGAAGGPKRLVTPGVDLKAEEARRKALEEWKRLSAEYVKGIDEIIAREKALAEIDAKNAEEYKAAMKEMAKQRADFYDQKVAADEADASALAALDVARADARKQVKAQQDAQALSLEQAHEMFVLEANAALLLPEKLKLEKDFLEIRFRYLDAVKTINDNQALSSAARIEALATEEDLMKRQLELATERYRINKEITNQQQTFSAGWKRAFDAYAKDANDAGKDGERTFQIFTDNVGRSIDELVDKGETSFARLTMSILNDMTKMYLKQQMMQIVGGMPSAAAGLGGIVKGLFSSKVDLSTGGGTSSGWMGFADGGSPPVGVPSIVGERGPEMFIPKESGIIIPNHSLNDTMNSQPSNVYNGPYIASMSAIDTQSGLQFLAKNKQGIWSSYQSANRSIPMSR